MTHHDPPRATDRTDEAIDKLGYLFALGALLFMFVASYCGSQAFPPMPQ